MVALDTRVDDTWQILQGSHPSYALVIVSSLGFHLLRLRHREPSSSLIEQDVLVFMAFSQNDQCCMHVDLGKMFDSQYDIT
jgi:hypothetical protein